MAMLVGNLVVGDSRVLKAAESAAQAGYRVTIVGERNRTVTSFSAHDDIPIYRISMPFERTIRWQQENTYGSRSNAWRTPLLADMLQGHAVDSAAVARQHREVLPPLNGSAAWTRIPVRLATRLGHRTGASASRAARNLLDAGSEKWPNAVGRIRENASTFGEKYREVWPQIEDYEEGFLRALVALDPDLVHVHDRHPMAAADTYASWRAVQGRPVRWVYDAHEWLPGVDFSGGSQPRSAWLAAERDLIQRADAVITVSDELAERMMKRHHLAQRPSVVVNAPSAGRHPMDPADRCTLRAECGLDESTPLLVYVGKLSESRGIFDAVAALPLLPGTHLAFVANKDPKLRGRLREVAAELGVAHRVHIHDYVPARNVTWYVASATAGLSPLHPTTAHEAALPTKIREYIQSGLPVVVSDLAAQASFVRGHGLGTVHRPGDAEDLAHAIRTVLDDVDRFAERLTETFARAHTWEGSEPVLHRVWAGLRPAPDRVPDTADRHSNPSKWLVVGPVTPAVRTVLDTVAELAGTDHTGPVFRSIERPAAPEKPDLFGRLPGLQEATAIVTEAARDVRAVVVGDALPALNGHAGSPQAERLALNDLGVRTAAILDPDALFSRGHLAEVKPDHPLLDLQGSSATRYDRQTGRVRDGLRHGQWPVLTWGELAARQFPDAVWLPYPAPLSWFPHATGSVGEAAPTDGTATAGNPRILIAGVRRSAAENRVLASAVEIWRAEGLDVVELPPFVPGAPAPEALVVAAGRAAILVDALASGEPTPYAVMAWAHGLTVVGGPPHPLREDLSRTAPLRISGLDALGETVLSIAAALANEPAEGAAAQARRSEGPAYVERVHRQESLARLGRALGTD
ncbi:glycosyltransferase family 4 protein [Zhihengliuella salsuginis]|nr:glycosyltransferase family 4 protein [Zhihengliuella salsuginis]